MEREQRALSLTVEGLSGERAKGLSLTVEGPSGERAEGLSLGRGP